MAKKNVESQFCATQSDHLGLGKASVYKYVQKQIC